MALRMTCPSITLALVLIGPSVEGATESTPLIDCNFAVTAGASATVVQTCVGCPWPPEKYLSAKSWALTESGVLVKL